MIIQNYIKIILGSDDGLVNHFNNLNRKSTLGPDGPSNPDGTDIVETEEENIDSLDDIREKKYNPKVKKNFHERFIRKTIKVDDSPFTYKEFEELLFVHRNENPNYDGLSYELIRKCPPLQKKLVDLYNIFSQTTIPQYWKYGIVYSTYKGSGESDEPMNYRSVVRCDTFSKLYWHLINYRIRKYINNDKSIIVHPYYQKAFKENCRGC